MRSAIVPGAISPQVRAARPEGQGPPERVAARPGVPHARQPPDPGLGPGSLSRQGPAATPRPRGRLPQARRGRHPDRDDHARYAGRCAGLPRGRWRTVDFPERSRSRGTAGSGHTGGHRPRATHGSPTPSCWSRASWSSGAPTATGSGASPPQRNSGRACVPSPSVTGPIGTGAHRD